MSESLRKAAWLPLLLAAAGVPPAAEARDVVVDATPLADSTFAALEPAETLELVQQPEYVGPYRLIRPLGSGGMGVVYLAESNEPVQRRVALKLIHAGSFSPALRAQFELEQQALANAEHEYVAKLFDAGTSSDGRPWFAMEYVDGETITQYCDRRGLDIDARLRLFADVCRAVEHLHARGMLHGDLKPANILVRERDGEAVPKLIDLGLARIGRAEPEENDALRGTPAYMAPEQFSFAATARDERCDVYALGVVLRELLVGPRPEREQRRGVVGAALRSTLEPISAPSEYLRELGESADGIAKSRGTRARDLTRRLRRSLDRIEQRATARDPEQRYSSAAQLAGAVTREVERHEHRGERLRTTAWVSLATAASFAAGWLASVLV